MKKKKHLTEGAGNKFSLAIITPCYNSGSLILETADSIRREILNIGLVLPDWRIVHVIIDDCSDDSDTLESLEALEKRDSCILLRNPGPRGPAAARNFGLRSIRAHWYGFLDADDMFAERGLFMLATKAASLPSAEWVCGESASLMPDGESTDTQTNYPDADFDEIDGWALIPSERALAYLARPPQLFLGTMLVRDSVIDRHGYFSEDLLFGEDWLFTLNIALDTDLHYCTERILLFRRGIPSLTQSERSLTDLGVKPTLIAYRDPRFRPVRRVLRWTLISQLKRLAERCINGRLYCRGCYFYVRAWACSPWEPALLGQALGPLLKCITRKP